MKKMTKLALLACVATLALSVTTMLAQGSVSSIESAARNAPDGEVRFSYAARPDVCGEGNSISVHSSDHNDWSDSNSPDVEWDHGCEHGPVRLVLHVKDHVVTSLKTYVGGRWRTPTGSVTDLGTVGSRAAASYLLSLAGETSGSVGSKAIFPATIADSAVVSPTLVSMARNSALPSQTRRDAVFWLSQIAGESVTSDLSALASDDTLDRNVKESAVFALSQRPNHEGIPSLIQLAQSAKDPALRRRAIFWLGQSNDPRAIGVLEQLIAGRR